MRNENEIMLDLAQAKQTYIEANADLPALQVIPVAARVKELQQELSDCLTEGAKPCPKCASKPHGMRFRTEIRDGVELRMYEVGCPNPKCVDHRGRGADRAAAVEAWNTGAWYAKEKK